MNRRFLQARVWQAASTIGVLFALTLGAPAAAEDDFYKDKRMTIMVGFSAGGGYGAYARLMGQYIGKYVPGGPSLVAQHMTGSGSVKAANYLYNVSPKDGSVIGSVVETLPLFQLVRPKGLKLDVAKFRVIGRLTHQNNVLMVRSDAPATTIQALKTTQVILASTGKAAHTHIYPTLLNEVVGTRFKLVEGYAGSGPSRLALERGEVHGMTGSWVAWTSQSKAWLDSKFITPVMEVGLESAPDMIKGVPLMKSLATNDKDREMLEFMSVGAEVGRWIIAPPGIPQGRLDILRKSFDTMVADPVFVAAATAQNLEIIPKSGVYIEELVKKTLKADPAMVTRVKKVLGY